MPKIQKKTKSSNVLKFSFTETLKSYQKPCLTMFYVSYFVKACVAARLTPRTESSGSGGPGLKPRPSRCFLRQGTLLHFVSLHPGV